MCAQLWKQQISEPSTWTLGLHQGLLCFLANKELRDLHILFPCSAAGPGLCWEKPNPHSNPCSSSVSKQGEIKPKFGFSLPASPKVCTSVFWCKRKNFTQSNAPFPPTLPDGIISDLHIRNPVLAEIRFFFLNSELQAGCEWCLCPAHKARSEAGPRFVNSQVVNLP